MSLSLASDGWSELERASNNEIVADPKKFPSGIRNVSEYVHSKGIITFTLLQVYLSAMFLLHLMTSSVSLLWL